MSSKYLYNISCIILLIVHAWAAYLFDIFLGSLVRYLHHMASHLNIAVYGQCLVRPVCVDADTTLYESQTKFET